MGLGKLSWQFMMALPQSRGLKESELQISGNEEETRMSVSWLLSFS